jgi:hypothetical protein
MTGQCAKCGSVAELVRDMRAPRVDTTLVPTVCFQCWRSGSAREMKKWYLRVLPELFFVLLPLLTGAMWLFWKCLLKYNSHWNTKKGFWLWLYLPTMLSVGIVPFVFAQVCLILRYGPKLELISQPVRFLVDSIPAVLWGITTLGALIAFTRAWK